MKVAASGVAELREAAGQAALVEAARLAGNDPLAAAEAMRAAGFPAELAATALTQATLRQRARTKFGPDAASMYFTRAGLEQATRAVVADRRAKRLAAAGVTQIADLGCGIGADSIAFARAGLRVLAVEADPETAEVARANVEALGLAGAVEVRCADATTVDLAGCDAAFCDPARRDGGRRRFDPHAFSPPWSFVVELIGRLPRTVVKLAPGLDHALIPEAAEAEWVSVAGDLVEAALWCGPLAMAKRRASLLGGDGIHELTGDGTHQAPVRGLARYVYEPDPAVIRAHLVAEFADAIGGALADPRIAYVFAETPARTPYGQGFEVLEQLPFAQKRLRARLRELGVGRLEILKRGLAVEPDRLRRELRLSGEGEASLLLFRLGDAPTALLCRRQGR